MLIKELKKIMPDADDKTLLANLKIINDDAQKLIDDEVKGLKDNKTKLLDQMSTLKKNQIPDGVDPESYKEYLEKKDTIDKEKKALEDKALEDKGQWDALRLKLNNAHIEERKKDKESSDTEIAHLTAALDKELIENAAIKAIEVEKGNSLFLLPHMRNSMKTVKAEDGTFSVQIFDSEGNPRLKDDATTPFGVKDLVAEMKAKDSFAPAFPEMNAGGGGNPNAGGKGGSGVNPWNPKTKNVTEQARLNRDNPALAAQYRKAAGIK